MGSADVFTSGALWDAYGSLLASILTGAELSVWMGAGRKAVERIWEVCDHSFTCAKSRGSYDSQMDIVALRVAGILADSEWDGWAALVQPAVLM